MKVMKIFFLWLPVVVWAGIIYRMSSIPHLDTGWGVWDLVLRKAAHMTEYAVLAFLLWRALAGTKPMGPVWLARVTLLLVVLYAVSDEYHQAFVPGRGPSLWDVCLDTLGGYLAVLVRSKIFS